MTYFELFDIPHSFRVDKDLLKKKFYRLSREFHPDHFTMESDEKQAEVLAMSGKINAGYKLLSDDYSVMKYILELHGLLDTIGNQALPQEFLLQMMDINEAIVELQLSPDQIRYNNVLNELEKLEGDFKNNCNVAINAFENQIDRESALQNIKEYYLKSKYLLRIRENISTFATA